MSTRYAAEIRWHRAADEPFTDRRYSRAHAWHFDGGAVVPASSSPHAVPLPFSRPDHVDPEEALVAAIASCHMLTFLFLAAQRDLRVDGYVDAAMGTLGPLDDGRPALVQVTLRPVVHFGGAHAPDDAMVQALHAQAHAECIIARSVRAHIEVIGRWRHADAGDGR